MGTRPTHPELLDFLANQYAANGWTMKPLASYDSCFQRLPQVQLLALRRGTWFGIWDRAAGELVRYPPDWALLHAFN